VFSGSATIINNTITRNRNTLVGSTTAGLLIWSGASASGKNNIIYQNIATSVPNISGAATMTYCDIEGGLAGQGNIDSNPLFVNLPVLNFCYLSQVAAGQTQNSPCVNAGDPGSTMFSGTTRTDHVQDAGIVDMGFHWPAGADLASQIGRLMADSEPAAQELLGVIPQNLDLRVSNYPNPFNPTTTINLLMDHSAPVDLKVYDVAGRIVANLFQGTLETGAHEFQFSGANLPAGVYVYRAEVSGNIVTGKALLVK
jgi:hypothetical protein